MPLFVKACIAFLVLIAAGISASAAPSFDCAKASTRVEEMICDAPALANLDSELSSAYKTALRDAPWASANKRIRREQETWITKRNKCKTKRCLRHIYHRRISVLYSEVNGDAAGGEPAGANPATMMAVCRDRAAHIFHLRQPNVETKYEGQRTDGTHAVNGTAYLRNAGETFQCSFNSDGTSIVQFIVN